MKSLIKKKMKYQFILSLIFSYFNFLFSSSNNSLLFIFFLFHFRFKNIVGSQKLKKKRDHMEILMDSVHEHSSRKKNKKNGFKPAFLKPADD